MLNITEDLLNQYADYMYECVEIAKRSANSVHPPYVGCLILNKDGKKVSEGRRRFIGGCNLLAHAERDAIQQARESVKGGTLITTLEPCKIQRRSDGTRRRNIIFKPCSLLIVEEKIKRVVYGQADPSECCGANLLRINDVEVVYLSELERFIDSELLEIPMRLIKQRRNGY